MPALYISAANKSSGKTTVSVGLCSALAKRNLRVQPFKKGPDYIDPKWSSLAATRPCFNLDFHTQDPDEILALYSRYASSADMAIIEGNKGLHDGMALDGSDSNASMAKLVGAPVLLVLDTRGTTRGLAPLVLGYQRFDPEVKIGGIILNQIAGARHESKIRRAIETYTDVPVVGALRRDSRLEIRERHLGLVPSNEASEARHRIDTLSQAISDQVNLDQCIEIANTAVMPQAQTNIDESLRNNSELRIGIAWDSAFGFYYQDDLNELERRGARLIQINMLSDTELPQLDGLILGGGFPETHLQALSSNQTMLDSVGAAIEAGLPTYAECGGLMYLSRKIIWGDSEADMVGIVPGDTLMCDKPQGKGYVQLRETDQSPWRVKGSLLSEKIMGHEFHYSKLINFNTSGSFAYEMQRGTGITEQHDGFCYKHLLACYSHQRHVRSNPWTERFLEYVREHRPNH